MQHDMRIHYLNWLAPIKWDLALSLNFRADIGREQAIAAARVFWHKLDYEMFGAAQVKTHKKRVTRACFIEGEKNVRNWHYHIAVQMPHNSIEAIGGEHTFDRIRLFGEVMLERWSKLREAGEYSIVKPIYDAEGWLKYICNDVNLLGCGLCTITSHLPV